MELGFPIWRGSGGVKYALREILRYGFDFVEIDLDTLKPSEIKNSTILKQDTTRLTLFRYHILT